MIVTRILGGLGNQMFQYAAGRALAIRTGQGIRLDISSPNPNPLGSYGLDRFRVVGSVASKMENRFLWRPLARLARAPNPSILHTRVLVEPSLRFQPSVFRAEGSVYLAGHWQSEMYFSDAAQVIRKDFTVASPPSSIDEELISKLRLEESVGVHIRRGDYAASTQVLAIHGLCDLDYYERARALLENVVSVPRYYVFSDDMPWARQALAAWPRTSFMDHNPPDARHEDLRLMASCRHFIVANSSFSWWAAWLGEHSGQIVVAPQKWFADPKLAENDIVPERWLRT